MAKYQKVISGMLVEAISPRPFYGWIGINNGRIAAVQPGPNEPGSYDDRLDFDNNCLVMPGFVDIHVHCREPGKEYKEDWGTLGLAAAHGGITTIATMPNYGAGNSITNKERLERVKKLAKKCVVDVRYWAGLSPDNMDDIAVMAQDPLVVGFKGFTTDFDPDLTFPRQPDDRFMEYVHEALKRVALTGKKAAWHCEDALLFDAEAKKSGSPWAYADWRTEESEYMMAERILQAGAERGADIHIPHASTITTVNMLRNYPTATCEASWHHILLNKADMGRQRYGDRKLRMNPPLRNEASREFSQRNICRCIIPAIASDHAPHTEEEKISDNPPAGVPNEDTYGSNLRELILSKLIAPQDAARVSSFGPASIIGLADRGSFKIGNKADFAVLRMSGSGRAMGIYSKCGWTPYVDLRDYMEATILKGDLLFFRGEPV